MTNDKSLSKKDLLVYIEDNQLIKQNNHKYSMQDNRDVLFLAVTNHKNKEMYEISKYQVKYVGYQGLLDFNSNSTRTGKEYKFQRGDWHDVHEEDWKMFYNKIEKAVSIDREPHWQVQKITTTGKIKSFFKGKVEEIKLKKPDGLRELPHMTSDKIDILSKASIRSIPQFLGLPMEWVIDNIGVERGQYFDMRESAGRAFT